MILSALWLPATLFAALFQAWRTALQQRLRGQLSVNAAGLVRYLYGVLPGALILGAYVVAVGAALPSVGMDFLAWAAIGGLLQIIATNLLIMAFGHRNFTVGTAYSKTEAMQGAVLALIVLGEALSAMAWTGIAVGVFGVLVLSLAGRVPNFKDLLAATVQPAALCGLAAGFFFALASVAIKGATLRVPTDDLVLRALVTLVVTNVLQTIMQGGWMAWREPAGLKAAFLSWRNSAWVGALSACGSACWFTGFACAPVALVRSVGQIEVIFTLLFSRFLLREALSRAEIIGTLVVVAGVILVLVGR
ncbi:MAG: EamA/RhaT family transporter [Alphaproteobacteria bacterium]|nr:EamA/RhaT family transporter [Alphaproteobacteria bacterium]